MTYRERAEALAVSLPATETRVRRVKWRRRGINAGALRVSGPLDVLLPHLVVAQGQQTLDLLAEMKAAHWAMTEELWRRAEAAEAQVEVGRSRADRAEREREEARVRAAEAEGENKGPCQVGDIGRKEHPS